MKNKRPYKTEGDRKNGLIDRQAANANAEQLTKAAQEKIITRRDFLQTAGVAAIGAVAVACAPAAVPAPAVVPATAVPEIAPTAAPVAAAPVATVPAVFVDPKAGGDIVWAINQDPTNLIPFGGLATANHWGKEFMYDSLIQWDKDLNV